MLKFFRALVFIFHDDSVQGGLRSRHSDHTEWDLIQVRPVNLVDSDFAVVHDRYPNFLVDADRCSPRDVMILQVDYLHDKTTEVSNTYAVLSC